MQSGFFDSIISPNVPIGKAFTSNGKLCALATSWLLENHGDAGAAIETAIRAVEDFEYYKSVGYGGLPNENMEVELDAAFMDGDTFDIGAVAAIKDFANPVSIAKRLSKEKVNCLLVGEGAEKFAHQEGFERKNMLTKRAKIHYKNRVKDPLLP